MTDAQMTDAYATNTIENDGSLVSFTAGLIAGGVLGAVLALAFAPRGGEDIRRHVARVAKDPGASASRQGDASEDLREALGQRATNPRARPHDTADAVVNG